MATRKGINSRAKGWEKKVQQLLWEGSEFAGHAKRPALEDQDVCGTDWNGVLWWGEIKSKKPVYIETLGIWNILTDALQQSKEAVKRNKSNARSFAVLCPVGSPIESPKVLVLYEVWCPDIGWMPVIMPLTQFKKVIIDGQYELVNN